MFWPLARAKYPYLFLGSSSWTIAAEAGIYKKNYCILCDTINNFQRRNGWHEENNHIPWKYGLLIKGGRKKIENKEKE